MGDSSDREPALAALSGVHGWVAQNLIKKRRKNASYAGAGRTLRSSTHAVYSQIPDSHSGSLGKLPCGPAHPGHAFRRGAPRQAPRTAQPAPGWPRHPRAATRNEQEDRPLRPADPNSASARPGLWRLLGPDAIGRTQPGKYLRARLSPRGARSMANRHRLSRRSSHMTYSRPRRSRERVHTAPAGSAG